MLSHRLVGLAAVYWAVRWATKVRASRQKSPGMAVLGDMDWHTCFTSGVHRGSIENSQRSRADATSPGCTTRGAVQGESMEEIQDMEM